MQQTQQTQQTQQIQIDIVKMKFKVGDEELSIDEILNRLKQKIFTIFNLL
jgi:hypothetical protein